VQVEAVQIRHLAPRLHELPDEPLFAVGLSVDLGYRAQLGVGAEHQVHGRRGPLELTRLRSCPS